MANIESGFPRFEGETDHEYYARLDAALSGDDIDEDDLIDEDTIDFDDEMYFDDWSERWPNDDDDDVWDWNDNDDFLDDLEESA